jgi:hypothetical protein
MDFAVCPSCNQSVLDDDAENCPFCGASMKAKPGAKVAVAKPVAAPAKPATKPPAKSPDDDLPFDVEANLPRTDLKLAPTPTKGRTLKVTCPMCDAVGYVPPSAAGQPVRCLNSACPMPVFQVPALKSEPPPPPPPKPKGKPLVWGVLTAVVVGGIGVGVWMVASRPNLETVVKPLSPEDLQRIKDEEARLAKAQALSASQAQDTPDGTVKDVPVEQTASGEPTAEEMIKQTLKLMEQAALQTGSQNRSKPFCRRLAAEAAALAGELPAAREHLLQLQKVGPELPFYRIGGLTEIFWREHAAGQKAAALAALDQALTETKSLPTYGRDHLDLATRLAAALAVAERLPAARELIQAHQSPGIEGETSAYVQTLLAHPDPIPAARQIDWQPIVMRQMPQAAAVSAILQWKGHSATALEWARGWSDEEIRAECLTALVEAALWGGTDLPLQEIEALPAENQLLLWARAARRQAALGQFDAAKTSVQNALTVRERVTLPAEFVLPDTPALMKWKPASKTSLVALAAGYAELAVVQQLVAEDAAAASTALERAVQVCRGIGPALAPIQKLQTEADRLGLTGLRQKLKMELELRTDDLARQMVGPYRKALTDLEQAAQERFVLQTMILSRAAKAGLEDAAWTIVSSRGSATDPLRREPYFHTEVAGWLVERFRSRGANDVAQAVIAAATEAGVAQVLRPVAADFEAHLAAGRFKEATALVKRPEAKDQADLLVFTAAARLSAQDPLDKTWQFISLVGDGVLREQVWELAGQIASRRGQAAAVFQQLSAMTSATEKIALGKGLIAGLQASRPH